MHKSWGNAIEFDEAAERMGVDVMRWMYAQRPARGQHPVRLARRRRGAARAARPVERLRVLRHLRAAGRLDAGPAAIAAAAGAGRAAPSLDRWILSRAAATADDVRRPAAPTSTRSGRPAAISTFIDDLSTWYLRLSRKRFSRNDDAADRAAAFATLHARARRARAGSSRRSCRS